VSKSSEGVKVNTEETRARKYTQVLSTILFVVIACVLLIFFLREERDSTLETTKSLQPGLKVPNFSFPDINGKEVSLSDHRGKVVLVNVWATWCPPCRKEMPSMQKLYEKFKGDNFEILAVSIDSEAREAVAPFMQKMNLTFPALLDPREAIRPLYGITGVPESFIIDRDGILVEKIIGPINWATPEVFLSFQNLIRKPRR
jgi:peroxiredoxin